MSNPPQKGPLIIDDDISSKVTKRLESMDVEIDDSELLNYFDSFSASRQTSKNNSTLIKGENNMSLEEVLFRTIEEKRRNDFLKKEQRFLESVMSNHLAMKSLSDYTMNSILIDSNYRSNLIKSLLNKGPYIRTRYYDLDGQGRTFESKIIRRNLSCGKKEETDKRDTNRKEDKSQNKIHFKKKKNRNRPSSGKKK